MNDHITYEDLTFDGGLWTVGDYLVPKNAAAELTDCYPQQGGGLRAWMKPTLRSREGIDADEAPVAFIGRSGVPNRTGSGSSTDFYLATHKPSTSQIKLYRWDETEQAAPYTEWLLLKSFGVGNGVGKVYFHIFDPTATPTAVYLTHDNPGSVDQGLWRVAYSNGAMTKLTTHNGIRAFTVHQERMLYGTTESNGTRLRYSDPASETFDAANFLDVLPDYDLSDNAWVKTFFGELLIGKEGAPLTLVQGDINDPTTRIMADAHPPAIHQLITEMTEGIVYLAFKDGYILTRTGVELMPLSKQLDPITVAGTAATRGTGVTSDIPVVTSTFASPFLITPSGHIMDTRTKAWFRTSHWNDARPIGKVMYYDRHRDEHKVYVLTDEVDFDILEWNPDEGNMDRNRSYTYRSAPLRHPSGRQMCVREVQIPVKVNSSGARVDVTVNGVTRRIAGIAAGNQKLRFPFMEEAEYVDVLVEVDSGSNSVEAPIIETIQPGGYAGHLVAPDTVSTV